MDLLGAPDAGATAVLAARKPFSIHGTTMVDVALRFDDGHIEQHRLGAESLDPDLSEGDQVRVERVMTMVVGVRRA